MGGLFEQNALSLSCYFWGSEKSISPFGTRDYQFGSREKSYRLRTFSGRVEGSKKVPKGEKSESRYPESGFRFAQRCERETIDRSPKEGNWRVNHVDWKRGIGYNRITSVKMPE